jgi:hypothetical protein
MRQADSLFEGRSLRPPTFPSVRITDLFFQDREQSVDQTICGHSNE